MKQRIEKVISHLRGLNVDSFLVTNNVNISYLVDFPVEDSWLLITLKGTYLITDPRYDQEFKQKIKKVSVKCFKSSIYDFVISLAKKEKLKTIGFDGRHLSFFQYNLLNCELPKQIKLIQSNNIIEKIRSIKEPEEICKIRKALDFHNSAHKFLKKTIRPGISEAKVFEKLEKFIKSKGVNFSFPPIIASGPNSCYPHAKITSRVIKNNEPVLVDMGIDFEGYKSDLTRMFFLGKISQLIRGVNTTVKISQLKAIEKIKPGISCAHVDKQVRKYLKTKNLDKFFVHSLGHGVGLEIHEFPRLSKKENSLLKEGMIVTVEPAVYLPNKFGIRIEDMVLITKEGCEVLSDNIN